MWENRWWKNCKWYVHENKTNKHRLFQFLKNGIKNTFLLLFSHTHNLHKCVKTKNVISTIYMYVECLNYEITRISINFEFCNFTCMCLKWYLFGSYNKIFFLLHSQSFMKKIIPSSIFINNNNWRCYSSVTILKHNKKF